MKNRKILAAVGGLILLGGAAAAGTAFASVPDTNGTIHGCYDGAGNLRVIDSASQSCLTGETGLNWGGKHTTYLQTSYDTTTPGGVNTWTVSCNSGDIAVSAYKIGAGSFYSPISWTTGTDGSLTGAVWNQNQGNNTAGGTVVCMTR